MAEVDERQHVIDTLVDQGLTKKEAEAQADLLEGSQDQLLVKGRDGKTRPAPPGPSIFD